LLFAVGIFLFAFLGSYIFTITTVITVVIGIIIVVVVNWRAEYLRSVFFFVDGFGFGS